MRNRPHTAYITTVGLWLAFVGGAACSKDKDKQAACDTSGAASTTAMASTSNRSLYYRLGGKSAITAVCDTFVSLVAADTRVNKQFARSNIPRVKTELVDQICAETGGPCAYTGRSMKEV